MFRGFRNNSLKTNVLRGVASWRKLAYPRRSSNECDAAFMGRDRSRGAAKRGFRDGNPSGWVACAHACILATQRWTSATDRCRRSKFRNEALGMITLYTCHPERLRLSRARKEESKDPERDRTTMRIRGISTRNPIPAPLQLPVILKPPVQLNPTPQPAA